MGGSGGNCRSVLKTKSLRLKGKKTRRVFFAVPPLPPHAPAAPQLPNLGKNTDSFMME